MEFCRIAPDVKLGVDVQIHAFVNLYGCNIGDYTKIGACIAASVPNSKFFITERRSLVTFKNS